MSFPSCGRCGCNRGASVGNTLHWQMGPMKGVRWFSLCQWAFLGGSGPWSRGEGGKMVLGRGEQKDNE